MPMLDAPRREAAACAVLKNKGETDVVIGISGPSGSGKSTLTGILHNIFENALEQNSTVVSEGQKKQPPSVITVLCDSHFIPKDECPRAYFEPVSPGDDYVMQGLELGSAGKLECPDTDCILALDYTLMCKTLETEFGTALASQQKPEQALLLNKEGDYYQQQLRKLQGRIRSDSTIDGLLSPETTSLAKQLVRTSAAKQMSLNEEAGFEGVFFRRTGDRAEGGDNFAEAAYGGQNGNSGISDSASVTVACRLAFVEGFLLYPSNLDDPLSGWGEDLAKTSDPKVKESLRNAAKLFNCLDLRLYLPLDRENARYRRLHRKPYVDETKGGERKPGQTWKTEGYFNDVAWPNQERYHRHLQAEELKKIDPTFDPETGGHLAGCHIRGTQAADLDQTILWAVQRVLSYLEDREQSARSSLAEPRHNLIADLEPSVIEPSEYDSNW